MESVFKEYVSMMDKHFSESYVKVEKELETALEQIQTQHMQSKENMEKEIESQRKEALDALNRELDSIKSEITDAEATLQELQRKLFA